MDITLLVIGIIFMTSAFWLNTPNILSALLFKTFPFLSGLYVIFYSAVQMGWIVNL